MTNQETRFHMAQSYYIKMLQLKGASYSPNKAINLLQDISCQLSAKDGGINSAGNTMKAPMLNLLSDAAFACADLIKDITDKESSQ